MRSSRFRVYGFGLKVRASSLGFKGFKGFKVPGLGFPVQGLG